MARMVRSVKVEITVLVTVRFSGGAEHRVLALIDTGCSIFAVAPRKLFWQGTLETARHQLRLSSVNSGRVTGGKLGTLVTVSLPICDSLGGLLCHCPGAFVYEAGVTNDLILGWPFLVAYQLVPCPLDSCIIPRESITVDMNRFQSDREQFRTNKATCGTGKWSALAESPQVRIRTPAGGGGGGHQCAFLPFAVFSGWLLCSAFCSCCVLATLVCHNGNGMPALRYNQRTATEFE